MVDVTPLVKEGAQIIQAYEGGSFRVSGHLYDSAVLVFADQTMVWDVSDFNSLTAESFKTLIDRADEIDVVLLGTGAQIAFLPHSLRNELKEAGLSVDVMDTGAACRTYNVLMAEGRRVVAALLPSA